jgi:hypothetical protein
MAPPASVTVTWVKGCWGALMTMNEVSRGKPGSSSSSSLKNSIWPRKASADAWVARSKLAKRSR